MTAAIENINRGGDSLDFHSFIYATASVASIRRALFPLDAQVELKVLAKIQVISSCCAALLLLRFSFNKLRLQVLLRKIPTIPELWKKLSAKKEKMFPDDFQESMCKLGLNLSKMEVCLKASMQRISINVVSHFSRFSYFFAYGMMMEMVFCRSES